MKVLQIKLILLFCTKHRIDHGVKLDGSDMVLETNAALSLKRSEKMGTVEKEMYEMIFVSLLLLTSFLH